MKEFNLNVMEALYKLDEVYNDINANLDWKELKSVRATTANRFPGIYIIRSKEVVSHEQAMADKFLAKAEGKYLRYVGQTNDIGRRLYEHRSFSIKYNSPDEAKTAKQFQHYYINRTTASQFVYAVLDKPINSDYVIQSNEDLFNFGSTLNESEIYHIKKYDCLCRYHSGGLNVHEGGQSGPSLQLTIEQIRDIRRRLRYTNEDEKSIAKSIAKYLRGGEEQGHDDIVRAINNNESFYGRIPISADSTELPTRRWRNRTKVERSAQITNMSPRDRGIVGDQYFMKITAINETITAKYTQRQKFIKGNYKIEDGKKLYTRSFEVGDCFSSQGAACRCLFGYPPKYVNFVWDEARESVTIYGYTLTKIYPEGEDRKNIIAQTAIWKQRAKEYDDRRAL